MCIRDRFNHALEAQLHEPYAMSLATASAQGRPHVRTVLLRGATEAGYDFYTNFINKHQSLEYALLESRYLTA